ncbi:unnamed protein product [Arabidopsis thaliana]|uniref:Uncharacterized protein n=1 Tax=Arabidopsis thaliana TaxID=3702 RepID=A0A654ENW6_ARATH|nr:unnamed protein product [Arabidopsis thaliana]
MEELKLSINKLAGQFPLCLTSLTGLRVLDLSSNQLTGNVPSALANLESLEYLSLFGNNFEGFFSLGLLANLSKLKVLRLDSQSNSLEVEFETSWKPKFQLVVIALRSCNLEKVPHFLLHQKDLHHVDLSDNQIHGNFPSWLLENNTKLEVLLLQNNSFTSFQLPKSAHNLLFLNVSVNKFNHLFPQNFGWILPHLVCVNLAYNGFQGNLPSSLDNMKSIEFLDLSHNRFHGKLPRRFLKGCYNLTILKLSHNKLSGEVFPEAANFTRLWVMSMDNNLFTGNIGKGFRSLPSLNVLDISNNNSQVLFQVGLANVRDYSHCSFQTTCWKVNTYFLVQHILSSATGPLFKQVIWGYTSARVIPDTLLLNVIVLDLRNNRLSGNLPEFINTQNISILLLRGNNFTGQIPHQFCSLSNIQLLDLSNNKFNGSIPSCLSNTSFGLRKGDDSYRYDVPSRFGTAKDPVYFESLLMIDEFNMVDETNSQTKIEFATKHRYDAYMGGNLKLLFGLDLSKNELSGEIPIEFGDLRKLHALNLSHNNLSGVIPESFSGLKNVESLDLSFNRLQGQIQPQLTDMISLAVFNVSYNNLSENRSTGKTSIDISCASNNFHPTDNGVEADESTVDMESFYWSFVAAYVTILLGILASLSFDSPWSRAWFYIVDAFVLKNTEDPRTTIRISKDEKKDQSET